MEVLLIALLLIIRLGGILYLYIGYHAKNQDAAVRSMLIGIALIIMSFPIL